MEPKQSHYLFLAANQIMNIFDVFPELEKCKIGINILNITENFEDTSYYLLYKFNNQNHNKELLLSDYFDEIYQEDYFVKRLLEKLHSHELNQNNIEYLVHEGLKDIIDTQSIEKFLINKEQKKLTKILNNEVSKSKQNKL
jgi:hypothetical protein